MKKVVPVDAVIVAYEPDPVRLGEVLQAIGPQVRKVHLVHNGQGLRSRLPACLNGGLGPATTELDLLELGENKGLAAAQNLGLARAFGAGAQAALLLDQDSMAAPGLVQALLEAYEEAPGGVAAVGAHVVLGGDAGGFVRLSWRRGYELRPAAVSGPKWVQADLLIASGTLMARRAWEGVGPMLEPLFIDRVDTEWCLRARAAGWRIIGAPRAMLHHQLGQGREPVRLGPVRLGTVGTHAPHRYYWMVRNALWLLKSPLADTRLRLAEARQWARMVVGLLLLSPRRAERWPHVWRGVKEGLRAPAFEWPRARPPD